MNNLLAALKKEIPFLLMILGVTILIFSPLLFGKYMFFDQEQIGFYYPQSFFHSQAIKDNIQPTWNNAYYGGISVGLDQFVSSYYPINKILFKFFSVFNAHHLSIFISVLVGCLFAYWFGRASKLGKSASLVLSLAYLSATTFGWLDVGTTAGHAFLVLPILLLALLKINEDRHLFFYISLGAVGLAVGFLAGFIQIVFYACAVAFLFASYLDWQRTEVKGIKRFSSLLSLGIIAIIAVILGGWQIWPSVFLVSETVRTASYATQQAYVPGVNELMTFFLPDYIHIPFIGGGAPGFYMGALPFLLAILSAIFWSKKGIPYFFALTYAGILAFAFRLPIFSFINNHLPPFSHFGGQFRWMVIGAFPLAYIAANGYQKLISSELLSEKAKKLFFKWGKIILALLFIGVITIDLLMRVLESNEALRNRIISLYFSKKTMHFPIDHYLNVLNITISDIHSIFSLFNLKLIVPMIFLVLAYILVGRFLDNKINIKNFEKFGLSLLIFNILFVFSAQYSSALVPQNLLSLNNPPPLVKKIKEYSLDPNTYRVASFLIGDSFFWKVGDKTELSPKENTKVYLDMLINNTNVFYDIQRLDGMEPYASLRHNQLLGTVLFPPTLNIFDPNSFNIKTTSLDQLINKDIFKEVTLAEKTEDFIKKIPLLSALNVKFIYSLIPLDSKKLKEIPLPNVSVVDIPLYLYENLSVMPRIYFANGVEFFSGRNADLLAKMVNVKDFNNKTFIECDSCEKTTAGKNEVNILNYENGLVSLSVKSEHGDYLVFGESYNPGWRAQIDGKDSPIYNANYILQSVFVPSGEHRLTFEYNNKNLWPIKKIQKASVNH